ncbi:hypothetical protein [Brevibacillus fortis]|uniref:Uncharacterized protein n=1 Tax=Brevibacillus fortis TaxID=2126352 RepID=A0A2P7V6E4_9BACL|nr:hypothetical protein [Brevibacillus fortis]PSJ94773.1 hypothetical protein C7R93_15440 [Brevibacillus fortis]
MFKLKCVLLLLVVSILFLSGCTAETDEISKQVSIDQIIKKARNDAKELEDFQNKLYEQGFAMDDSTTLNKLGDDVTFNYSVFRKGTVGYIHIEFIEESKKNDELTLGFDANETNNPIIIHSDGLNSPTDYFQFKVSSGLDKQWVGIYFEGKKTDSSPNGEIVLNYGSDSWRSHY